MIDFCISPLLQQNVKRMMAHVNLLKTFTCTYLDFFSRGKGGGGDHLVVKGVGLAPICL